MAYRFAQQDSPSTLDNTLDRRVSTSSSLSLHTPAVDSVEESRNSFSADRCMDNDRKDSSSLLQMWWGLMQDQLGAMKREVDSLRSATSQLQARLSESLMHRTTASEEMKRECSELLAQVPEELKALKNTLYTDRQASNSAIDEVSAALRAEMNEFQRKFSMALVDEQQSRNSCLVLLQSQVAAVSTDLSTEREEQRRSDLQSNVFNWIQEQGDFNQKAILEHVNAERSAREQQMQKVLTHLEADKEDGRRELTQHVDAKVNELLTKMLSLLEAHRDNGRRELMQHVDANVQELRTLLEESRKELQQVLDANSQNVSADTMKSEVEMLRGAFTQMFSDSTTRLEKSRKDHGNLRMAQESAAAEVKVLSEACSDMHGRIQELQAEVKAVSDAKVEWQRTQTRFSEQLLHERSLREKTCAELVLKVEAEMTSVVERQAKAALKLDSYTDKTGSLKQDIAEHVDILRELITEERRLRENAHTKLERSLKKESEGCTTTEVQQMVTDICSKERDQTKTLLSQAKQLLDSDVQLRERLSSVLQCEMVSRDEFSDEINRLWNRVISESYPSTGFLQTAPVGTTPSMPSNYGSLNATPGREGVVRVESLGPRRDAGRSSRGSSPLPPGRMVSCHTPRHPRGFGTAAASRISLHSPRQSIQVS